MRRTSLLATAIVAVALAAGAGAAVGIATRSVRHASIARSGSPLASAAVTGVSSKPAGSGRRRRPACPERAAVKRSRRAAATHPPAGSTGTPSAVVQVSTASLSLDAADYRIRVSYPQLSGLAPGERRRVDTALRGRAEAIAHAFATEAGYATGEPGAPPGVSTLDESAQVTYLARQAVSVMWTGPGELAGAAGPSFTDSGLSLALPSGRPVSLAQLFRAGVDYLTPLAGATAAALRAQRSDLSPAQARRQVPPAAATFAAWSLVRAGIRTDLVHASAALGDPHVVVAVSALSRVARPAGLFADGG